MNPLTFAFFSPYGPWLAALTGLIVGSFLNVCISRWPDEDASVVTPRSRCPVCLNPIVWFDNIPILSWLVLRGRCRNCSTTIPLVYPGIELLTGALFAGTHYVVSQWIGSGPIDGIVAWTHLITSWVLVSSTIVIIVVDIKHFIIPDQLSLNLMPWPPLVACFIPSIIPQSSFSSFMNALRDGDVPLWQWPTHHSDWLAACTNSVLGIVVGAGGLWLLGRIGTWLLRKEAMGHGDVKLMGALGALLGVEGVILTLVAAAFLGSVVGGTLFVITRNRKIPFGPWLMIGGLLVWAAKWTILRSAFILSL